VAHRGRQGADEVLLQALACGASVEAASRAAGVSARTAHRRLADAGFHARVRQARADMVHRTAGTMTAAATEAVRTLLELLKAPAPAAVRLGAARAVLEIGLKVRELVDLEERLAALEGRLGGEGTARQ
jgi:hypothetical protein